LPLPIRTLLSAIGATEQRGVARGIDAEGALQLECDDGRIVRIVAGEVSVRARGDA